MEKTAQEKGEEEQQHTQHTQQQHVQQHNHHQQQSTPMPLATIGAEGRRAERHSRDRDSKTSSFTSVLSSSSSSSSLSSALEEEEEEEEGDVEVILPLTKMSMAEQRRVHEQHGDRQHGEAHTDDDDDGHQQRHHEGDEQHEEEEQDVSGEDHNHQQQQQRPKRCINSSRYFFSQEPPKLCSVIYAEFDNDIGRVIRFQVPDEIFDKQRFDTISSAIIPSEEMRDRMIKINMYDYKITGHPVGIKDKKYQREVFIFNLCFVVAASDVGDVDDSVYYEPLVQKCAEYLIELEQERCFLSEEKHRLPALMRQIFDGLNQKGECVCRITDQTTIYLRLCPPFLCREPPPHPLSPFLVPIFTRLPPPVTRAALNRMDVLSRKICPQIDGVRTIKDIASVVQIDADLVGRCVRNLCFHGCVSLLPQFLYSNCYVPTERLRHFFCSPQIVEVL